MTKFFVFSLVLHICALLGGSAAASDSAQPRKYRLYWPTLTLAKDKGERIESLQVLVSCGRFRGVTEIPSDWSLEIASPSSGNTTLRADAGHGATTLWNLHQFNGTILISIEDRSCFDISGEVTTTEKRQYSFGQTQLRLVP